MNLMNTVTSSCRMCLRSSRNVVPLSAHAGPSTMNARLGAASRWRQLQRQEQQQRLQSSKAGSIRVKDRPSLFLHPTNASSDQYALSFLPEPPVFEGSPTVLGTNKGQDVTPRTFEENPDGRRMIHEILSNVYTQDAGLQTMAVSRGEGFLHIIGEQSLASHSKMSCGSDVSPTR